MHAHKGDALVVRSHHIGEPNRAGEVVEARGTDSTPPFLVRWDDGHTSLLFPGPDCSVEHLADGCRPTTTPAKEQAT
jgi:hypothetical protein